MEIYPLGLRRILLANWCAFLCFGISTAKAQDGNAVGGSVRSAETEKPLEDVGVTVVNAQNVQDQTRKEDGVYTLKVPASIKSFDILYQKAGYLDATDRDVSNNQTQQKRPIVRLTPVNAIKSLPVDALRRLLQDSKASRDRGLLTKEKILEESGKKNLAILLDNIPPTDPIRIQLRAEIFN
jgi:hypothetical protein